jgi:hypothetical protein
MMDEFLTVCGQLHDLTAALQTALLAEDIPTFARIVRGREPLLWRAVALWEAAAPEARVQMEPQLCDVLTANTLVIEAGEAWLRDTRRRLLALRQGVSLMERYRAPLTLLAQ